MSQVIWPFIFLTYISIFCLGFVDNIRGPLFSEILIFFHLTDGQGAWFFTISSGCSLLGSLSSVWIVNRLDRIRGMRLALLTLGLGAAIITFSQNFFVLLVGAAILGFSFGLMGTLQNVLVTIGASSHLRQQFVTGLHAMYGLASLLAPLIAALMMRIFQHWRWVFAIAALFPLLSLIYTYFFTPELFHRAKKHQDELRIKSKIWTFDKIFLASFLACYTMVELLVATRLPLYLQRKYNFNLEQSSLYLSYFYFLFLFSRVVFSAKKFDFLLKNQIRYLLIASIFTLIIGIGFEPWFLIASALFMAPCFPLCITYISDKYKHDLDSMMLVVFSLQAGLVVTMHLAVGYLSDVIGLQKVFWIGPIFLLISIFMLNRYDSKKTEESNLV
jgi:fucose permease